MEHINGGNLASALNAVIGSFWKQRRI